MLSNIDFGSYFHTKKYEKGLSTGGDKIADWGGSKGGWGGHVPPSLYVKRGPALNYYAQKHKGLTDTITSYPKFPCVELDLVFLRTIVAIGAVRSLQYSTGCG